MSASKGGNNPQNLTLTSKHLTRLSQNAIQRIAHTAGVPRICVKCYDAVRQIICNFLTLRLQEIMASTTTKTVGFDKTEVPAQAPVEEANASNDDSVEFSKSGFEAVVRDIAKQLLTVTVTVSASEEGQRRSKIRFHKALFDQLQDEVEAYLLHVMNRARVIMDHSCRRVVYPKDIMFVVNELL